MSDVEHGLQGDLLPQYNELSEQNTTYEENKPALPTTQEKRKRSKCCVSWHTLFWWILTIEAILYPIGVLVMCHIKMNIPELDPSIKDAVLSMMWQGLIFLPIAIVAQWLARPESPPADPKNPTWRAAGRRRSRRTFGVLLFILGTYLSWVVSFAFFLEGPIAVSYAYRYTTTNSTGARNSSSLGTYIIPGVI